VKRGSHGTGRPPGCLFTTCAIRSDIAAEPGRGSARRAGGDPQNATRARWEYEPKKASRRADRNMERGGRRREVKRNEHREEKAQEKRKGNEVRGKRKRRPGGTRLGAVSKKRCEHPHRLTQRVSIAITNNPPYTRDLMMVGPSYNSRASITTDCASIVQVMRLELRDRCAIITIATRDCWITVQLRAREYWAMLQAQRCDRAIAGQGS
jgi:hypothetical protein